MATNLYLNGSCQAANPADRARAPEKSAVGIIINSFHNITLLRSARAA